MSKFVELPLLKEPPLIEVLYGLQAISSPAVTKEHVRSLVDASLGDGYSIEDMNKLQVIVKAQTDGKQVHEQEMEWGGCKAVSADKTVVVHLMREGLFVSFLPPYKGFPECIEAVQKRWELYQRCFAPEQVVRIGIRYINLLKIPVVDGSVNFGEFFKLLTFYPVDGPFHLHRFHHQFEVSEPEYSLPARINFTSTKETRDQLEVVLDIETYEEVNRPPADPEMWDRFDRARHWAYKLFTNALTEQCFQRYQ